MGVYENWILPSLIDWSCSTQPLMNVRRQVVQRCRGTVLEVGAGSGINFPLYDPTQVQQVYALEPSASMRRKAVRKSRLPVGNSFVQWLNLPGEDIPLADSTVDTVLLTFTLCTIGDYAAALRQMYRVLKPGGQLLFCEHGRSPDAAVRRTQDRLTPIWRRLAGGCHLNRPIADLIRQAEFEITSQNQEYLPQVPRFAGYIYHGNAVKSGGEVSA
ncbi:MAG: class I SAM-dependent methyltransferase [Pirellulaceae bacterium]|nr:class I SAM-dependent methyltransferase [Pirellulaceae bacterium]